MQNVRGDAAGKIMSLPYMLGDIKMEGWCVPTGPHGSSQPDGRREVQKLWRKSFFVFSPSSLQQPRYKGWQKVLFENMAVGIFCHKWAASHIVVLG